MLSTSKRSGQREGQSGSSSSGSGMAGRFDGNRDPAPESAEVNPTAIQGISNNVKNVDISGMWWSAERGARRDFQGRQGPSTLGRDIVVNLNAFPVTKLPEKPIYQYSVQVGSGAEKRGLIKKIWASNAVKSVIGKGWLFDGNTLAWSLDKKEQIRINVDLDAEEGKQSRPGRSNIHRVTITPATEVKMDVLHAYLRGQCGYDKKILEAITVLDHIMREGPSGRFISIKRAFFYPNAQRSALGGGINHTTGVYQSLRIAHHPGGHRLVVNVDTANGTFWQAGPLTNTVLAVTGLRAESDIVRLATPGNNLVPSLRRMKRLRVIAAHRKGHEDEYVIDSFLQKNAAQYMLPFKDPSRPSVSVQQYFQQTHNIRLRHPEWPVVQMTKKAVLPLELLKLKDHQRYNFKLSDVQTAAMIKLAVTPPQRRWTDITTGVSHLAWKDELYLRNYGLSIDTTPVQVKARLIQNPKLQFGGTGNAAQHNPGTSGRWDLRGKRFAAVNPIPLKVWGICVIPGRNQVDQATVERFVSEFVRGYMTHGGNIAPEGRRPEIHLASKPDPTNAAQEIWTKTGNKHQARPQILMFILPTKDSTTYGKIKKHCETRLGVVSQCVQFSHVQKCQGQYISNVCMKFNAKLGGFTNRAIGNQSTNNQWGALPPGTVIVGCDVSHAAPGSPGASMAALTVSMNSLATRYAAACETNGHRVEMVTDENIQKHLMPLIRAWSAACGQGKPPTHVIYFRDGVSEGQFSQVIDQEVQSMKNAFSKAGVNPKFLVIIASKRHHVRFFPKPGDSAGDKNSNPLPGTLVETGVTQPFENDFYLNSHVAIKGTARPVHYNVLLNEPNMPNERIQTIIYEHSYQYIRATTPVSLFPAVYYAHLASNRAAHHSTDFGEPGAGQTIIAPTGTTPSQYSALMPMASPELRNSMWYI